VVKISMIVAMAGNRVIGCEGGLPWRLPSDLQRFRALTMGHALLMGRRTYESIGRALEGRRTMVLSRNPGFNAPGCEVVTDITKALELVQGEEELFLCGGEELYRQTMHLAERVYLTELVDDFDGDCFFPILPEGKFREIRREKVMDRHDYYFSVLEVSGAAMAPDENKG